ncbi:MAG: ABC transporter ATP-binding protein [Bacteroidota bacterium]|nr:ABC transporter ATP-binding protein [Bacteroidota bacterium]
MLSNSLEVHHLVCGYSQFQLKDISFNLQKGSFTGIIGPNGSGKTTLLKGILGEIKILKGKLMLDGKEMNQLSLKEKASLMAVVTQHTDDTDMSVTDYVLLGRMPYRKAFQLYDTQEDIARAETFMEMTGISHLRKKSMSELSGGEKQLVSIAKALTQEPALLLLDEPTSMLDISHQVRMLDLVRRLNQEMNLTVLMIIHDLNLASEYCDELLMMHEGTLYKQGTPEAVIQYQSIETVYNTCVVTGNNPVSGKPAVFLVSGDQRNRLAGLHPPKDTLE